MKTLKKLTISTMALTGFAIMASGGYNSMLMKDNSFMTAASDIKFAKRLDEIHGKVVFGRMAASTAPVKVLPEKVEAKKPVPAVSSPKKQKQEVAETEEAKVAPPAINEVDGYISGVNYKEALKEGSFSGRVTVANGEVQELDLTIAGSRLYISSREAMQGNVFTYIDEETNERKSGVIYPVRENIYSIHLADHSRYPNIRIEITDSISGVHYDQSGVALAEEHYQRNEAWGMNKQNHKDQTAEGREYKAETEQYDNGYDNYEEGYEGNAGEGESYGFNFQS